MSHTRDMAFMKRGALKAAAGWTTFVMRSRLLVFFLTWRALGQELAAHETYAGSSACRDPDTRAGIGEYSAGCTRAEAER